ncbi:hypothetical protein ADJ77_00055 [Prevotella fusca JCM 17724]|uniref:Uncharacterized protein n=1 Tax=Prevotella fusca JCM 17724 TaxID=1236517 RepID=A0A0K1NHE9_9BACT|nr:hypothetical protein ADJ77_00055 [Prevotella fusca JCM 17724]
MEGAWGGSSLEGLGDFFLPLSLTTYNLLKNITMSERSKRNRRERELKQEKQAKRVVIWIAAVLILLAIASIIVFTTI